MPLSILHPVLPQYELQSGKPIFLEQVREFASNIARGSRLAAIPCSSNKINHRRDLETSCGPVMRWLRWRDVDMKTGMLTIPRSKNGETWHVPMNATVREIFSRLPRSLDRAALVFPNSEGKRDLRWAEKTFPAAVSGAKIEDFRLHDTPTHLRVAARH